MALALLPLAVTRMRPRYYMIAIVAFLAYATLTSLWSPRPMVLIEFNPAEGDYAVRSEVLRQGLLIVAIAILIAAAERIDHPRRAIVMKAARYGLLAQLVIVSILALFEQPILQALTVLVPDTGEGVQNISRNSLIMAAAAPFLIQSLTEDRTPRTAALIAVSILALESAILLYRGVNGGVFALFAALLAIIVVAVFRRSGFRILASGMAALVWTAPMFFGFLSLGADATKATTSSEWRLAIWRRVVEITSERPIEGSGLGVLRTVRDVIPEGTFAGQYEVPNHAHNMLLQLWAETGAIGAALVAVSILMVGWRMPEPQRLGVAAPRIAGLAGGMTAIACVSFDLWDGIPWAAAGYLAVLAAVVARDSYAAAEAAAPKRKRLPAPQVEVPVLR